MLKKKSPKRNHSNHSFFSMYNNYAVNYFTTVVLFAPVCTRTNCGFIHLPCPWLNLCIVGLSSCLYVSVWDDNDFPSPHSL